MHASHAFSAVQARKSKARVNTPSQRKIQATKWFLTVNVYRTWKQSHVCANMTIYLIYTFRMHTLIHELAYSSGVRIGT
jgi:hypothetical protein